MALEDFLFEAASLKNVPRSGWFKVGIENPESVAEHSFLSAVIAFFLGLREYGSMDEACKCSVLALFHDIHESRTLDIHHLARKYIQVDEEKALKDLLNFNEGKYVKNLISRYSDIVHDADKIELFIQSRIYGLRVEDAKVYGSNVKVKTEAGKELLEKLKNTDPRWWMRFEVHR